MTVMIALLRGINVGGTGTVSMAEICAAAGRCGYDDVRSYVQSGNLVLLRLPGGVGRSRLAVAIGRHTVSAGTQRNWRTVTKLAELADEVAAAR